MAHAAQASLNLHPHGRLRHVTDHLLDQIPQRDQAQRQPAAAHHQRQVDAVSLHAHQDVLHQVVGRDGGHAPHEVTRCLLDPVLGAQQQHVANQHHAGNIVQVGAPGHDEAAAFAATGGLLNRVGRVVVAHFDDVVSLCHHRRNRGGVELQPA